MEQQINQDLSSGNCSDAISLATQIYNSPYSDNTSRMLYASAHACNAGINLFQLLQNISNSDFSAEDSIIRAFVRLFPASSSGSQQTSAFYAQDALESVLNNGIVVNPTDQINFNQYNVGSDQVANRTLDSSSYLIFTSMAVLGTSLNIYGYTSAQNPASLSYGKGQNLSWTTKALVLSDNTGSACGIASGFLNLFDGITEVIGFLSGATSSQLQLVLTNLQAGIDLVGAAQCASDGYNTTQCTEAATRLRYRGACAEQGAAASFTAGVIQGINAAWQ